MELVEWAQKLCEDVVKMQADYHRRLKALLDENAALRAQIAATASDLSELQDRVTMLEQYAQDNS